jgi:hypothetical protein
MKQTPKLDFTVNGGESLEVNVKYDNFSGQHSSVLTTFHLFLHYAS